MRRAMPARHLALIAVWLCAMLAALWWLERKSLIAGVLCIVPLP
jgi:hypothetical protein